MGATLQTFFFLNIYIIIYTQAQQGRCLLRKEEEDCRRIPFSFQCHTFSCFFSASSVLPHPHPSRSGPLFPLQTWLSPCRCYSRVQKERVYPWLSLLPAFGSSSSLYFQDLISRFKWETCAFSSVRALAKLDPSILCLFTGQVKDRQHQSEISRAALHSTRLCCDPDFYRGQEVVQALRQLSRQPTEYHAGWLKYAKLCVVIKWNGPWSIKIWANYNHIN